MKTINKMITCWIISGILFTFELGVVFNYINIWYIPGSITTMMVMNIIAILSAIIPLLFLPDLWWPPKE